MPQVAIRRCHVLTALFLFGAVQGTRKVLASDTDISIYLMTARELWEGGFDIYRPRGEIGAFGYPAWVLLPFRLLEWLLGETPVRVLFGIGQGVATLVLFRSLDRCAAWIGGLRPWQWVALGALTIRWITANYTNGQLSLWVAALMTLGVARLLGDPAPGDPVAGALGKAGNPRRPGSAGALLGVAAAMKLTPGLFLPALPFARQLRSAVVMGLTLAALVLLVPWPFLGTEAHLQTLQDFKASILAPRFGEQTATEFPSGPGASITGTLDYLLQARPLDESGRTFCIVDLSDGALAVAKAMWSGVLALLLGWWFFRAGRRLEPGPALLHRCAAIAMGMALFSPLTRTYHLSATLLPVALFCGGAPLGRGRPWPAMTLWWLTAACLALATTLRQKGLLGRELWWTLDHCGLLHFGLVGVTLWCTTAGLIGGPPSRATAAVEPSP